MIIIKSWWQALQEIPAERAIHFECPGGGCLLPLRRLFYNRLPDSRASFRIGMPQATGKKGLFGLEVQIKTGRDCFLPGTVRKTCRRHCFVRWSIGAKPQILVNTQKRAAGGFRIGNQVRTDSL